MLQVARYHLPAHIGDLRLEGALGFRMLSADLHSPLPGQLEGLLSGQEVLLGPLEVHRRLADPFGLLIHAWRRLGDLAQGILPRGSPLFQRLSVCIEPFLHWAQQPEGARVPLAHRPVDLVTLPAHEPLALLRYTRLERELCPSFFSCLRSSSLLLLLLKKCLCPLVDRRAWRGGLVARAATVDVRPEGAGAHGICLKQLLRLPPKSVPLVGLMVQPLRQRLNVAAPCPAGIELRPTIDRWSKGALLEFPGFLLTSSLLLLLGKRLVSRPPILHPGVEVRPLWSSRSERPVGLSRAWPRSPTPDPVSSGTMGPSRRRLCR
mmetsp:Transcript_634/g.1504  ORF Transcript_634/g.1504 Transcript_634/m.1504 type:complete len:320 (+) Transcript_634:947-1906(+)